MVRHHAGIDGNIQDSPACTWQVVHSDPFLIPCHNFLRCGPCKMISPFFEKLSEKEEYAKIIFMKVDVDQNPVSPPSHASRSLVHIHQCYPATSFLISLLCVHCALVMLPEMRCNSAQLQVWKLKPEYAFPRNVSCCNHWQQLNHNQRSIPALNVPRTVH